MSDLELIVVDDGSTDGGADAVRQICDPRLRIIVQENVGVSAARNRGVLAAKSVAIAFIDADDVWESDFLETVLSLRERFLQAAVWGTAYRLVGPTGAVERPRFHGQLRTADEAGLLDYFAGASGRSPLCASAVLIDKEALEAVGGFPTAVEYGEDHDTWLRLALRYDVVWSPFAKALVYEYAENHSGSYLYLGNYPFFESLRDYKRRDGAGRTVAPDIYQYLARRHTDLFLSKWLAGERTILLEIARDCRDIKGYGLKCWKWQLLSWIPYRIVKLAWRIHRWPKAWQSDWPQFRQIRRPLTGSPAQ